VSHPLKRHLQLVGRGVHLVAAHHGITARFSIISSFMRMKSAARFTASSSLSAAR
jgi:hypothetical protein